MKALSNRAWMGPRAPGRAIIGDLIRFVLLAFVAGLGFAVLLAVVVVALTLTAPPAAAREIWPTEATGACLLVGSAFSSVEVQMKLARHSMLFGGLVAPSMWQAGDAAYIQAKAWVAQQLLRAAWERSLGQGAASKPWPWADTHPVARLYALPLKTDLLVLSGASGRTRDLGPAHVPGTALPGQAGNSVLSGHRDTHFAFLRHLHPGDVLTVQAASGAISEYRVRIGEVVHRKDVRVMLDAGDTRLTLITSFPFDGSLPGGALRYVVVAVKTAERTLEL
jgi:sortase A